MEKFCRCSVCGKEFYDSQEEECLSHEIDCLKLKPELDKIVKDAISTLNKEYGVEILEEEHNVVASTSNYGYDYEIYKYFKGKAKYMGREFKFHIFSDSVGDGRYESTLDTPDNIVTEFNKYLREKQIEFNNIRGTVYLEEYDDTKDNRFHSYDRSWKIGEKYIEDILYSLEGKKIKIEIIE